MKIIKRSGEKVEFSRSKIVKAIMAANKDVGPSYRISAEISEMIADKIYVKCCCTDDLLSVEDIQNEVESHLMEKGFYKLASEYIKYRYVHKLARDKYSELMDTVEKKLMAKDVANQNANVDEKSFGGRVGEASSAIMKQYALDYCMSDMSKSNHLNNEIYIHDLDSYASRNAQLLNYSI